MLLDTWRTAKDILTGSLSGNVVHCKFFSGKWSSSVSFAVSLMLFDFPRGEVNSLDDTAWKEVVLSMDLAVLEVLLLSNE